MPKRETRPGIRDAINRVEKVVRSDMTKDGLVQFRIEKNELERLYELAEKYRKPLGTMVREWVLERVTIETEEHSSLDKLTEAINRMRQSIKELEQHKQTEIEIVVLDVDLPNLVNHSPDECVQVAGRQVPIFIVSMKDPCKHKELTEKIRRAFA